MIQHHTTIQRRRFQDLTPTIRNCFDDNSEVSTRMSPRLLRRWFWDFDDHAKIQTTQILKFLQHRCRHSSMMIQDYPTTILRWSSNVLHHLWYFSTISTRFLLHTHATKSRCYTKEHTSNLSRREKMKWLRSDRNAVTTNLPFQIGNGLWYRCPGRVNIRWFSGGVLPLSDWVEHQMII